MRAEMLFLIYLLCITGGTFLVRADGEAEDESANTGLTERERRATGQWSSWSEWSSCSRTCGSGIQTRSRTCSTSRCTAVRVNTKYGDGGGNQAPLHKAVSVIRWSGSTELTESCTNGDCPTTKTKLCSYKAKCGTFWMWTQYCIRFKWC